MFRIIGADKMDDSQTDTLSGIRLTKHGKEPVQEMQFVKGKERADIFREYARDAILAILKKGIPDTMTTWEIEEETGQKLKIERHLTRHALSLVELARLSSDKSYTEKPITKSQVIHHLPKLIEHGFVIKYGTLKSGKRSTDYYRRTSDLFIFSSLPNIGEEDYRETYTQNIQRIEEVFGIKVKESQKEELLDLLLKNSTQLQEGREYLIERSCVDISKATDVDLHRMLYRIYAFKSDEWIAVNKRLREIFFPEVS